MQKLKLSLWLKQGKTLGIERRHMPPSSENEGIDEMNFDNINRTH